MCWNDETAVCFLVLAGRTLSGSVVLQTVPALIPHSAHPSEMDLYQTHAQYIGSASDCFNVPYYKVQYASCIPDVTAQ